MEKRINKVLLLVTIALLGPIGLGTVAAAPQTTPQNEGWAEASSEAQPIHASTATSLTPISTPKTQNSKLKTQNPLTRHWTYLSSNTLYERAAFGLLTSIPAASQLPNRLLARLGSSAGGLPL
jgi:hypothetical protein